MNVIIEPLGEQLSFADFCDRHNITVVVRERSKASGLARWYATGSGLEIIDGQFLCSTSGNGNTPEEAVEDYARQLAGQRLAHEAYKPSRREFVAPNEWLTTAPGTGASAGSCSDGEQT